MNVAAAAALFVPGGVNLLQQQLPYARGGLPPYAAVGPACRDAGVWILDILGSGYLYIEGKLNSQNSTFTRSLGPGMHLGRSALKN